MSNNDNLSTGFLLGLAVSAVVGLGAAYYKAHTDLATLSKRVDGHDNEFDEVHESIGGIEDELALPADDDDYEGPEDDPDGGEDIPVPITEQDNTVVPFAKHGKKVA